MFLSPQTQRNPQILLFLNDPTVTLILVSKMYDLATMGKSSFVIVRRLKALADHLHSILRVWEKTQTWLRPHLQGNATLQTSEI